jgi:hypothetical protein
VLHSLGPSIRSVINQLAQTLSVFARSRMLHGCLCARQSALEPRGIERLQKIIDGVEIERPHSVHVMCRYEDQMG